MQHRILPGRGKGGRSRTVSTGRASPSAASFSSAGTHPAAGSGAEKWVPAFAGTAEDGQYGTRNAAIAGAGCAIANCQAAGRGVHWPSCDRVPRNPWARLGRYAMEIRQLGPQIGVEVRGIDVKTMSDEDFGRIYQAWLDHNVMCVRDQDLTIPDFIRYSERFGPVTLHPSKSTRHPEHPKITMLGINKFDEAGKLRDEIYRRGAEGWHTDGAYNQAPFKATQLYALAVPSRGGNTMFANAYAAYDSLPQRLKDRLDGVIGAFSYGGRRGKARLLDPEDQDWQPVYHPIIRIHPETGRKSLYFDP